VFAVNVKSGRRALPWADGLPDFCGYDVLDVLPWLFYEGDGAAKARHDYWRTVSRLFTQAYSKQLGEWCDRSSAVQVDRRPARYAHVAGLDGGLVRALSRRGRRDYRARPAARADRGAAERWQRPSVWVLPDASDLNETLELCLERRVSFVTPHGQQAAHLLAMQRCMGDQLAYFSREQ